jgi:quinol-cytochrome oxidoreductase complex cytochrome b subunit
MSQDEQNTNIKRVRLISRNFFLHFHAAKINPYILRPTYTFGLGLMLAGLFIVMIITGFFLMMNYTPSVERAYDSVKDIVFIVPGGRYIRNIHRWAAHGMVLITFLHLIRTFLTGAYFGKRKVNWIIGVGMMLVVLFMNFSGYLLPWDQLAYWAVTIGSNIAASFRELTDLLGITNSFDLGGFFKKLLIGGESVGQPALTRFFMLHVIFLPLTLLVLTGWHFWRIRKDGGLKSPQVLESTSPQVSETDILRAKRSEISGRTSQLTGTGITDTNRDLLHGNDETKNPAAWLSDQKIYSWPVLMWIELTIILFVIVILMIMATLFNAPLREQANPMFSENPAKAPWYFLGIQELVSYSAFAGGVIIPLLFIVFLISIPFIDREEKYSGIWFSGKMGEKLILFSVVFSAAISVALIFIVVKFGWIREWIDNIPGFIILLVNPATISALLYITWSILIMNNTRSTRMAGIALFTCAITGLIIYTAIGIWFRGPDWEFYWTSSQLPLQ